MPYLTERLLCADMKLFEVQEREYAKTAAFFERLTAHIIQVSLAASSSRLRHSTASN